MTRKIWWEVSYLDLTHNMIWFSDLLTVCKVFIKFFTLRQCETA